jgi:serine/threonine protein kinase
VPLLETYGNYQLVEKLAMGGMAQLYLARRRSKGSDRTVVLKRILPHLAEDTAFVTMFLDEARIAARLHHPNVIEILDLGAEGDSYFIAMEYIHGEDLRRITKRGIEIQQRMPPPLVCRVVAEACRGLDYAHKRTDSGGKPLKIVHRDVSPQNILVGFDGSVKVVDFGIAKAADKATVTASGVIKGKHAYMSPEQALGREIDHRTDVFALGIVLFESLTATRLFRRATDLQTLKAVSECRVEPPSRVFPAVPQELDAILLKALTRDPNARYQSALQLAEALEGWLGERSDGSKQALGAYVSALFRERLDREAKEGKFVPTRSAVDIASISRQSPPSPNQPTASLKPAVSNKTLTEKHEAVPASPLESRNTDVTPAFVPPDNEKATPAPLPPAPLLSAAAKPVLTEKVIPAESGGTALYGRPLGNEAASGGTAVYGKADPKTITDLSERAANAIATARPSAPRPARQSGSQLPAQPPEPATDKARDLPPFQTSPPQRMWPWWVAAGLTTLAVAGGVAKLLVDRKEMLLKLRGDVVQSTEPSTGPATPTVDAGLVAEASPVPAPAPVVSPNGSPVAAGATPEQPPPGAVPPGTAPTQAAAKKKPMSPFGSVPVASPAFPLSLRGDQLSTQLPGPGTFEVGESVRIVGPPRGGTRERDFYGVASVIEVKGNDARLMFDELDTLPDGLFVTAEDEGAHEGAAAPAAAKGLALVGSLQLKQDDAQADVAMKNATDFDWTQCEVRLPDNRVFKLAISVVVKAGTTQWLSGGAFKARAGAADPKLSQGFGFVKCAEGDGYLKAAYLP